MAQPKSCDFNIVLTIMVRHCTFGQKPNKSVSLSSQSPSNLFVDGAFFRPTQDQSQSLLLFSKAIFSQVIHNVIPFFHLCVQAPIKIPLQNQNPSTKKVTVMFQKGQVRFCDFPPHAVPVTRSRKLYKSPQT